MSGLGKAQKKALTSAVPVLNFLATVCISLLYCISHLVLYLYLLQDSSNRAKMLDFKLLCAAIFLLVGDDER